MMIKINRKYGIKSSCLKTRLRENWTMNNTDFDDWEEIILLEKWAKNVI